MNTAQEIKKRLKADLPDARVEMDPQQPVLGKAQWLDVVHKDRVVTVECNPKGQIGVSSSKNPEPFSGADEYYKDNDLEKAYQRILGLLRVTESLDVPA